MNVRACIAGAGVTLALVVPAAAGANPSFREATVSSRAISSGYKTSHELAALKTRAGKHATKQSSLLETGRFVRQLGM